MQAGVRTSALSWRASGVRNQSRWCPTTNTGVKIFCCHLLLITFLAPHLNLFIFSLSFLSFLLPLSLCRITYSTLLFSFSILPPVTLIPFASLDVYPQHTLWPLPPSFLSCLAPRFIAQTNMMNGAIGVSLKNELWWESLWSLTAVMMYLDESMYSDFHFMWHNDLLLSTFLCRSVNENAVAGHVCLFSWPISLDFHSYGFSCLVTLSAHLSRSAYLKCFKRLFSSFLFVVTGQTTFSAMCTSAAYTWSHTEHNSSLISALEITGRHLCMNSGT